MSKKRLDYTLLSNDYYQIIELDDEDDSYLRRLSPSKIIEMLNEQENIRGEKRFEVIFYGDVINCVRDENGKEYNLHETITILNEQQDTIFKLQDICGKSDGENAKLRIENKRLEKEVNLLRPTNLEQYEQIQKLQEENEQLKNRLNGYI